MSTKHILATLLVFFSGHHFHIVVSAIGEPSYACINKLIIPDMALEGVAPYYFNETNNKLTMNVFTCDHANVSVVSVVRNADCSAVVNISEGVSVSDASVFECYDSNGTLTSCTHTDADGNGLSKNAPATVTIDPSTAPHGSLYTEGPEENTGTISFCIRNSISVNNNVYVDRQWSMNFNWTASASFGETPVNKWLEYETQFNIQGSGGCPNEGAICGAIDSKNGIHEFFCATECSSDEFSAVALGTIYLMVEVDSQAETENVTSIVDAMLTDVENQYPALTIDPASEMSVRQVSLGELFSVVTSTSGSVDDRTRGFTLTMTPSHPSVVDFHQFGAFQLFGEGGTQVQELPNDLFDDCVGTHHCEREVFVNTDFFDGTISSLYGEGSLRLGSKAASSRRAALRTSLRGQPDRRQLQGYEDGEKIRFRLDINAETNGNNDSPSSGGAIIIVAVMSILLLLCVVAAVFCWRRKRRNWPVATVDPTEFFGVSEAEHPVDDKKNSDLGSGTQHTIVSSGGCSIDTLEDEIDEESGLPVLLQRVSSLNGEAETKKEMNKQRSRRRVSSESTEHNDLNSSLEAESEPKKNEMKKQYSKRSVSVESPECNHLSSVAGTEPGPMRGMKKQRSRTSVGVEAAEHKELNSVDGFDAKQKKEMKRQRSKRSVSVEDTEHKELGSVAVAEPEPKKEMKKQRSKRSVGVEVAEHKDLGSLVGLGTEPNKEMKKQRSKRSVGVETSEHTDLSAEPKKKEIKRQRSKRSVSMDTEQKDAGAGVEPKELKKQRSNRSVSLESAEHKDLDSVARTKAAPKEMKRQRSKRNVSTEHKDLDSDAGARTKPKKQEMKKQRSKQSVCVEDGDLGSAAGVEKAEPKEKEVKRQRLNRSVVSVR